MTGVQPIAKVRDGSISIAVFDGKFGKSVILQKSYKDKKNGDKWVNKSLNLFEGEVSQIEKCIAELKTKIQLKEPTPRTL